MRVPNWLPPIESGAGIAFIGLVARAMKRLRRRTRFGGLEDEKLVTDLVERAVQTQAGVLEDLRRERIDDRQQIERLQGIVEAKNEAINALRERVSALEREVKLLAAEKGRLEARLGLEGEPDAV